MSEQTGVRAPASAVPNLRTPWAWLVALTLLGAALRFYRLGSQPFWLDEVYTRDAARVLPGQGFGGMSAIDGTSPVYTALASLAISIGQDTEWWLRLPAALAGTALAPSVFFAVRRLFGRRSLALAATVTTALSPFAVYYSQEARGYSLVILISVWFVTASHWAVTGAHWTPWRNVLPAVLAVIGLGSHVTFGFIMGSAGLAVLAAARPWSRMWWWAAGQALAVLAFLPWLLANGGEAQRSLGLETSSAATPLLWLGYALVALTVGPNFGPSLRELRTDGPSQALAEHPVASLAIVLLGLLLIWTWWRTTARLGRGARSLLALWIFGPTLALMLAVLGVGMSFNPRYAAASVVPIMVLTAVAVDHAWRSRSRAVPALAALAVLIWGNVNWLAVPEYAKDDLRSAVPVIQAELGPDDVLLIANESTVPPLETYGFTCPARSLLIRDTAGLAPLATAVRERSSGRTLVLENRQWEGPDHRQLESALAALGPETEVWNWSGTRLSVRPTALAMITGPDLETGCSR